MSEIKRINCKVRNEQSASHSCSFLSFNDFNDMICSGFTPLSKNTEVLAGIDRIADLISSLTIHLRGKDKDKDVRIQNSLSRLIDIEPNKFMTRKTFIYNIVRELLLTGNSVVIPEYEAGLISNLDPIASSMVSFVPDKRGYYIQYGGETFTPDEVLHFVNNPKQPYPWKGNSYNVNLQIVVDCLAQASQTKKGFMESKYKPSLIIKADGLSDGLGQAVSRSKIIDEYMSSNKAGEPWLIPAETFEVKEVKPLTLNDLALNDSVELDKKTVASVLGIPAFVLGVGSFNSDEWNNFVSTKIRTICNIIEQEITRKLIIKPEWYTRFNARSLYAYDIQTLSTVGADQYTRGIMTGNEVRDWISLDPKDGLDELVILENYIPQGMIGDQKKLNKQGGE